MTIIEDKSILNELAAATEQDRRKFLKRMMLLPTLQMLSACGGDGDDSPAPDPENPSPPQAPSDPTQPARISSFSIPVLPDTQFYPRYASGQDNELYQAYLNNEIPQYDNPFKTQTQWIVDNSDKLNIPFTIHLGDVVDQSYYYQAENSSPWTAQTDLLANDGISNGSVTREWELASQAMQVMEKATPPRPYSILAGNHDMPYNGKSTMWGPDYGIDYQLSDNNDGYQDGGDNRTQYENPYLKVFPVERARQQSTFGGRDPSGYHEYHVFEAEGNKFMVLSLSWRASDAALSWANKVIADNQKIPVILVNHQLVGIGSDGKTAADTGYSNYLWDKLIKNNDQIFMAVSGHYHGSCRSTKKNSFGHDVLLMVVDYQMEYMGGNGLMRMYEFDLTHGKIIASSFSPWVPLKPEKVLNQFDQAWLTEENHNFELPISFKERFSGFNPDFHVPTGRISQGITDAAKSLILTNYKEPPVTPVVPAKNPDDYPKVDGTLAHWRFFNPDARDGDDFPYRDGAQIIDSSSAGKNPVFLNTWMGQAGDLKWSSDHHPASSAPGSLQFLNSTYNRASYFTTTTDSALNTEKFPNGYTIEAFMKTDAAFDASLNGWMGILYRLGVNWTWGGELDGDGDSPMMLAVSNLMEIQWSTVLVTPHPSIGTCWSGSIVAGQWFHIAAVNDTKSTTLYVGGAPVLRNNSVGSGINYTQPNQQMAIGCGQYGGNMKNGFFGSLGEIRIVAKPLAPDQWLTARAA